MTAWRPPVSHGQVLRARVAWLGARQPASECVPALVHAGTRLLVAQTGATLLGLAPITISALGGIAPAFGLSLGLGSREITRNMIAGFYARKVLRPGDTVTVGERTGTLVMMAPTQPVIALLTREELAVSNGVFLDSGPGVAFTAADRSHDA